MVEVPERSASEHAARAKLNPEELKVRLSPELTRRLAHLEAAVHDSKHFSPDIMANLREYAGGKPFASIGMAFTGIATITQETMKHVHETGDKRAEDALNDFINEFHEDRGKPPFTLVPHRGHRL